jgi:hypothetical protein
MNESQILSQETDSGRGGRLYGVVRLYWSKTTSSPFVSRAASVKGFAVTAGTTALAREAG